MSRTVGVTGASGFIGQALVRRLAEQGDRVVGLDLQPVGLLGDAAMACRATGGRFLVGSVTDPDAAHALVDGCDLVVHTAALVAESGDWRRFVEVNARSVGVVGRAAREAGVPALVHLSSVMVHGFDYPDGVGEDGPLDGAGNAYCWTKILSEREALGLHEPGRFEVVVVRPGDVYGPGSVWTVRPVEHLRNGTFLYVDPAHALFNHVYVDNLVDAVLHLAAGAVDRRGLGGRPYTVTDGVRTLSRDYYGRYQAMTGVRWAPSLPGPAALTLARAASGLPDRVRAFLDLERDTIRYLLRRGQYASARVRETGWLPAIDLDAGMARTESWLAATGRLG